MGFILNMEVWFNCPNSMNADSAISKTHTAHQPRQKLSFDRIQQLLIIKKTLNKQNLEQNSQNPRKMQDANKTAQWTSHTTHKGGGMLLSGDQEQSDGVHSHPHTTSCWKQQPVHLPKTKNYIQKTQADYRSSEHISIC